MALPQGWKREEWLQVLLNEITDGCWVLDEEWRYQFVNEAGARLVNMTPEQIIGHALTELFPEVKGTPFYEAYREAMEKRTVQSVVSPFLFRDGRKGFYEVKVYPVTGGILCIGRDITTQKRMEMALEKKNEELRIIFDANPDCTYVTDTEGNILMVNRALLELQGLSYEQMRGKNILEFFAGDDPKELQDIAERLRGGEEVRNLVIRVHTPDGSLRDFEIHAIPLRENGEVKRILSVARDVTEQKKMERALRESEEKFRTLVEHAGEGVGIVDEDERFIFANPSADAIFGVSDTGLTGRNLFEFLSPEQKEVILQETAERKKGEKSTYELEIIRPDGKRRTIVVTATPRFSEQGKYTGAFGVFRDVTEEKEMERKVRESEARLHAFFNATHDLILVGNPDDETIVYVNEAMAQSIGKPAHELIGARYTDMFPPDVTERRLAKGLEVRRTKKPLHFVDERAGRWFDQHVYPILDEDGEVKYIAWFVREITEQKRMEQALKVSEEKYRSLYSTMNEGIAQYRLVFNDAGEAVDYVLTDMNPAYEKFTGMERKKTIGKRASELYASGEPPHLETFLQVTRSGKPASFEMYFQPTQKYFIVSVFSLGGEEFGTVLTDITSHKKLTEQLRESEEKYRALFECSPESITIINQEGIVLDCNEMTATLFKRKKEEIIDAPVTALGILDETGIAELYERLLSHEENTGLEPFEIGMGRGDSRKWFEVFPSLVKRNGDVHALQLIIRDVTERKWMEKMLRLSEERFRNIVERLFGGVFAMDLQGKFTYTSSQVREIAGYEPEEVIGTTFKRYIYKRHLPILIKTFITLKRGREVRNLQYDIVRKDGSRRTVEINAFPEIKDGKITGIYGTIRDISRERELERKISRLSQLEESIIDAANVWVDVLDEQGNVVLWNRAAELMSGYTKEEVIGHNRIWEWLYPDEHYRRGIVEKALAIIQKGDVAENFETTITCKDGSTKIISWNSRNLVDGDGTSIGSIAFGRDITEHKRAEEEIRKFKTVADSANYGVAMSDLDGTLLYVNDYFARIHGYTRDELIGRNLSMFHNEEQLPKVYALNHVLVEEGSYTAEEVWHAHRDGHVFPMLMSGTTIKDERGTPLYMATTAIDLTKWKRMEEKLSQQEKMAALGTIAAVVAHELNTPLANIAITAQLLLSQLGTQYEDDLHTIKREVEYASSIIKKVLGFSRMGEMEMTEVDVAEIVSRAIESVRNMHPMDGVIIQNEMVSSVEIMGDRYRLFEAFTNLISNAVLARDPQKKMHHVVIDSSVSDNALEITITDNGVGMGDAVVAEAKKPFFTTRPKGEGTGLGLFIADWIIERHGGSLSIKSAVGRGTTVTVHLPTGVN